MSGKYREEDKYRVGGPSGYVPPREGDHPPTHMKMDMDMRDRDMRHSRDAPMFPPNKERVDRGRDGMGSQSQGFEKKGHSQMRSGDYGRGESRHSPDRHGPTLDERFRHTTEKPSDSRMHFNREELEKITIDIRRNVREPSPTVRRILNPEEIKVVRRPGEGHRPLFEREEIKKPMSDLREDASFERRVSINKRDMDVNDDYAMNRKHPVPDTGYLEPSRQSLSERWQGYPERKGGMPLTRMQRDISEERNPSYRKRSVSPLGYRDQEYQGNSSMNRNIGRDQPRDERPLDRRPPPRESVEDRRDEGDRDFMRPFLDDPGDLRYSLSRRKEGSFSDDRRRSSERSHERREPKERSHYSSGKGSLDMGSGRYRDSRSQRRSRSPVFDRERNRDSSRDRGTDFSQRPDRFKPAPWDMKPEHDDRDRGDRDQDFNNRRRGRGRMLRSRGFRGRNMRGGMRGNFRGRMFRGNMNRGRPFYRRGGIGGRSSPRQWEHDLFNKMSPEKNDH